MGTQMNLYLISQGVNRDYDTYDSAVVAAESEEDARSIHPGCSDDWGRESGMSGTWCAKEHVKVELIGTAIDGISGVICSSFNAG